MPNLAIVGSGIVGLAHAVAALDKGWTISVFDRTTTPRGASVRNFGTIWPIGQPVGPARDRALRGAATWQRLSAEAGFYWKNRGSLHLAYSDDAWQVLMEFTALQQQPDDSLTLIAPGEIQQISPHIRQANLRGGLFSTTESVVIPGEAIVALRNWLEAQGVSFYMGRTVTHVGDHELFTGNGNRYPFDRLLVCSGDEIGVLYPDLLQESGVQRVKLQMMRTTPQSHSWTLNPILVSELTLTHYKSFLTCPTRDRLTQRLKESMPLYDQHGIHVIAVQQNDGALILGDSHDYGADFSPNYSTEVEQLILQYLEQFLLAENLYITDRWNGYYLKAPANQTEILLTPQPDVQVITGLGGGGMTMAFGLAEETIASWTETPAL